MISKVIIKILNKIIYIIEKNNFRYAIFGGLALPAWGRIRNTLDIDIMLVLNDIEKTTLIDRLKGEGLELKRNNIKLQDIQLARFIYHDNESLIDIGVDIAFAKTEYYKNVIRNSVGLEIFGSKMNFAKCEDIILLKLLSPRPIDVNDAKELIQINKENLDFKYLENQAKLLGINNKLVSVIKGGKDGLYFL